MGFHEKIERNEKRSYHVKGIWLGLFERIDVRLSGAAASFSRWV